MEYGTVILLLVLGAALVLLASWRFVRITFHVFTGGLKPADDSLAAYVRTIVGTVGYVLLLASLIVAWGTIVVTFFLMKPGSMSGVPLGIALLAFPVFYPLSELLVFLGRQSRPNGVTESATQQ